MKSNYILSLVFLVIGLASCKKESGNIQQESLQDTTKVAAVQEPSSQTGEASQPSSLGHDFTFLTDKLFHYKNAFGGAAQGQHLYKDEWIDFAPDGTYKAGKLKDQTHTGKWAYNHDVKVLLLKPDVNTFHISEWNVKYNDQMMIWVGTQSYGNQSTQVQLVRSDVLP